jgi:putative two-component system response regulator
MKYFLKRYLFLVIAQTACLALGLWLENRFLASLSGPENPDRTAAESADRAAGAGDAEKFAPVSIDSGGVPAETTPFIAIRITALLWIAAIQAVVAYLVLTRDREEATRKHRQVEKVSLQQYNELSRTRDAVIFGLAKLAESRDPDTGKHLERIAIYSTRLASALRNEPCYRDQVTPSFIKLIGVSSALHDIGKVGVQDSILLKPGKLERQERLMIQLHAAIGGKCIREIESRLGRSNFLQMAREIAFGHHEHWDGSGYPKGLAGEEIPLAARIVAIADVYDALFTKRIYKEAYPHKKCVEMIRELSGRQFDPVLVKVFLALEAEFHEIALRHRDASEEIHPEPQLAEDGAELPAENDLSLEEKFSTIETMLDRCAEFRSADDPFEFTRDSEPAYRAAKSSTAVLETASTWPNIESEPEYVPEQVP